MTYRHISVPLSQKLLNYEDTAFIYNNHNSPPLVCWCREISTEVLQHQRCLWLTSMCVTAGVHASQEVVCWVQSVELAEEGQEGLEVSCLALLEASLSQPALLVLSLPPLQTESESLFTECRILLMSTKLFSSSILELKAFNRLNFPMDSRSSIKPHVNNTILCCFFKYMNYSCA